MRRKFTKFTLATLLLIFTFMSIGGSLLFVRSVKAVGIPVDATIIADVTKVVDKVEASIGKTIQTAVINMVVQTLSYFARKVAYDAAVWLAAGGKGESALIYKDGFGDYLENTANEAGGKAIDALSEASGLNLCKIPDIKIDLALKMGLKTKFDGNSPQAPNCTFTEMTSNWSAENWESMYGSSESWENRFNASFAVDQTDLGLGITASAKVDQLVAQSATAAELKRLEGKGVKAVESVISGEVRTPAQEVQAQLSSVGSAKKRELSDNDFGKVMGAGVWQILPSTLSMFINTFLGEMVSNLQKGMFPFGIGYDEGGSGSTAASYTSAGATGGRRAAEKMFSELLMPSIQTVERYNILADLSSCPSSPGMYNCAMDENFAQAVQEERYGKPITIKEAIDKGWLNRDWKLIPPDNTTDNSDKNCYQKAYCYSNIVKLRRAGILPLGFEIATLNSNPDSPWTLNDVVEGFDKCNYQKDTQGNIVGISHDPVNYKYCHLIDPNWVLKVSLTKCNAMGYTNTLLTSAGAERVQECVDMSTCVSYDSKGNCLSYGYCLRDKNTWRLDAEKCDSQYRTCVSFKDSSKNVANYLYRTLDTSFCDKDNSGCSAYSLKQKDGKWQTYSSSDLSTLRKGEITETSVASWESSMVYLNSSVSTKCSSGSGGCSAFSVSGNTTTLYVKKAPSYLNCYDTELTTKGVQWPKTKADLSKLNPNKDCANYAGVCIADEANCNWYILTNNTATKIPGRYEPAVVSSTGKIVWNDQCDAKCEGYDAYREMSSSYSNGQDVAYIIPSSGSTCTSDDEGCASFTDLSTTSGGLEKVDYYSYLRPCILPDTAKQKTFYTYEGSTIGGYQLKVYVLEKDSITGGPKYFYRTSVEKNTYDSICSEQAYKAGTASLDCRQFNDDEGKIYYRLLSKTIVVDKTCTPYRLNDTDMYIETAITTETECDYQLGNFNSSTGKCDLCFQGGEYKKGFCFYYGLPSTATSTAGASRSCSASVNTCKAYKGNAGNNIKQIFKDDFESTTTTLSLKDWSSNVFWSAESTHVGEHSMGYTIKGSADKITKSLSLTPYKGYTLSFWAKASGSKSVTINLKNDSSVKLGTIALNNSWNYYKLGPVDLVGTVTSTVLEFDLSLIGNEQILPSVFLDNVELTEITSYVYLVKNTLTVDAVCDSSPNDNLPGEALGCSAYTDPNNNKIYLTGFSYLCRDSAIGCTALIDTYNTETDINPNLYNVWITGIGGSTAKITLGVKDYTCSVPTGETGCYVKNISGFTVASTTLAGGIITTSTIYIPADTNRNSPIYLVANKTATCNKIDVGCVNAGKEKSTPTGLGYDTVLIKNDPASYNKILCQNEAVGCNAYTGSDGANLYFKDPSIVGNKICQYKTDATVNSIKSSGWFWKGVGACGTSTSQGVTTVYSPTQYCSSDSDCSAVKGYESCVNKDSQPCYPNYKKSGNVYDIWSYGTTGKYEGFVGECPEKQAGCTEFIDHSNNDQAYYVINDSKIKTAVSACNTQVSQNYGCVLFDQTDIVNKYYHTTSTYEDSKQKNYALAKPISSSTANNSNIIMKVVRDRECGEWLQCRTSHTVWDDKNSKYKEVCDYIGRCDSATTAGNIQSKTDCANWVTGRHDYPDQLLTQALYVNRDVSRKGMDFSGFSMLDVYPVEELVQFNIGASNNPDYRLVKAVACGGGAICASTKPESTACLTSSTAGSAVYQSCGKNNEGICINGLCVQSPNGKVSSFNELQSKTTKQACRSYPEKNSPFPNFTNMAPNKSQVYTNVNFCNEAIGTAGFTSEEKDATLCECNYGKYNYGDSLTKYWNYTLPNNNGLDGKGTSKDKVDGICSGSKVGKEFACDDDSDCASTITGMTGSTCQLLKKESRFVGWSGYCLEEDSGAYLYSDENKNPCLTWYPIENPVGALDINSVPSAGYQPSSYGNYYCLEARGGYGDVSGKAYRKQLMPETYFGVDGTWVGSPPKMNKATTHYNGGYSWVQYSMLNKGIYLRDIDRAVIVVGNKTWPFVSSPDYAGDMVHTGTYYIRNGVKISNSTKSSVDSPAQTRYGKYGGTMVTDLGSSYDKGSSTDGCTVVEADAAGVAVLPTSKSPTIVEACDKTGGEILLNDDTDEAESKIYTIKGVKNNGKKVMRFFWDNQDSGIAGTIGHDTIPYIFDGYGFFSDIGDKLGYDDQWSASEMCDNGNEIEQDTFEVYLLFDKNDQLEELGVANCSSGEYETGASGDDNSIEFPVSIYVDLREYCTAIAEVSNGTGNAAWTDKLWQSTSNKFLDPTLKYSYSIDEAPLGSLSMKTLGTGSSWAWLYSSRQLVNSSGTIFGCYGQCGGEVDTSQTTPVLDFTKLAPDQGLIGSVKEAKKYLPNFFAKTLNVFTLGEVGGVDWQKNPVYKTYNDFTYTKSYPNTGYTKDDTAYGVNYNYTEIANEGANAYKHAPQIRTVFNCQSNGKCYEGPEGITVNNKSNAEVQITSWPAAATMKFYTFADINQMPLKQITINWGDGTVVGPFNGMYRNKRGLVDGACQSGTCNVTSTYWDTTKGSYTTGKFKIASKTCTTDNDCKRIEQCLADSASPNFGQVLDTTCENGYQSITHSYQCIKDQAEYYYSFASGKCPQEFTNGCCIYYPKAKVKDNWGWCNGVCGSATGDGGIGCYNAHQVGGDNECDSHDGSWTSTSTMKVIVAPQ